MNKYLKADSLMKMFPNNGEWWILNKDDEDVIYTRRCAGCNEYMRISLRGGTVSFDAEIFILKSDEAIVPQSKETNEFVKYSAKYGSWRRTIPQLTEEDLEFALKALKKAIDECRRKGASDDRI